MDVKQPIIIIGAGRCGSTAVHRLLSRHSRTAWMSGFLDKDPSGARNRQLLKLVDMPIIGPPLRKRYRSWECYQFWNGLFGGFAEPYRDLFADDVTPPVKARIRAAFEQIGTGKRDQVLIKITGWPRIGFLNEIFPDARFLHVLRDGRAVAGSNIEVDFWDGWVGPEKWRFGPLSPEHHMAWKKHNESFAALAAIEWNILMDAVEHAKTLIPTERFLEVKYEEFCDDPLARSKQVCQYTGLDWTDSFGQIVKGSEFKNQNGKWRKTLSPAQQAIVEDIVSERVRKYGYMDRDDSALPLVEYRR